MKQQAWNVYLEDSHIDTVFYDLDCTLEYVLDALVNHDGYSPDIHVSKLGKCIEEVSLEQRIARLETAVSVLSDRLLMISNNLDALSKYTLSLSEDVTALVRVEIDSAKERRSDQK